MPIRLCLAALLMSGTALANALPPTVDEDALRALLEGGWRYDAMAAEPTACGDPPAETSQTITFDFRAIDGLVAYETADGDPVRMKAYLAQDGDTITLTPDGGPALAFQIVDEKTLKGLPMESSGGVMTGKTLRKCFDAADRSKIALAHDAPVGGDDLAWLSQGGLGDEPRFVDMRFGADKAALCTEPVAQYLFFDLVGPLGFSMGRWNSAALAEMEATGQPSKVSPDEVANWTIEAVTPTADGWTVTATELIPPNDSRGDTATITLVAKGDILSIPEWKRDFLRCTTGEETTEVP